MELNVYFRGGSREASLSRGSDQRGLLYSPWSGIERKSGNIQSGFQSNYNIYFFVILFDYFTHMLIQLKG